MILHMLCLLMVMMMFNSVISAPGQLDTVKDTPLARKDDPKPKSYGTLDPLGGGHLLRADSPDISEHNFRSLELLVSYQDDIPQDMILVAREDKQKPSSSGTLDPIGGGNLVRFIDPEADTEVFRALESLLDNQNVILENVVQFPVEDQPNHLSPNLDPLGVDKFVRNAVPDAETEITKSLESHLESQGDILQNGIQLAREDNPKKLSPNLDPIGGGNLVRKADSDTEAETSRSLKSHLENQDDILKGSVSLAREDKEKPSSSGTLDSLGGTNIVRVVDPDVEAEIYRSLKLLFNRQLDTMKDTPLARKDDPKSKSYGTLDPLGGGHLLKADSPDISEHNLRSLELFVNYQDDIPQDMILVAREDKQKPSSSGTLDPIGGGNLVRFIDSEEDTEVFRALESLLDNKNVILESVVQFPLEDQPKHLSPNLDPLGGGNFVRNAVPDAETEIAKSLESHLESQDNMLQKLISVVREDKPKSSSSGTLDSIGGGNLVRIIDPEAETEFLSSLKSLIDDQGRQNMMRLAREDKSMKRSSHALDGLGGGHLVDPYRGQVFRSLDHSHLVDTVDQGGDVQRMLDSLTASDLLSLDSAERMAVLNALRSTHTKYPKRMLDSVSGWAFGESKRNFDEIDNVGFTGFAKRGYPKYKNLALAKKNFDEIDRAGFETYNKRDFDEIDRTGFDTFEKRDRKE